MSRSEKTDGYFETDLIAAVLAACEAGCA